MNCKYDICWGSTIIGNVDIQINDTWISINKINIKFYFNNEEIVRFIMSKSIPSGRYNHKVFNWLRGIPDYKNRVYEFALVASILNYNLSLTDPIWLNPIDEYIYNEHIIMRTSYDRINFYDNEYPYEIGNILLSNPYDTKRIHPPKQYLSPDLTTGGEKNKRWTKIKNKNFLIKQLEWMSEEELKLFEIKKREEFAIANTFGILTPEIRATQHGYMTSCLCEKGDFLFSIEQLQKIFPFSSDPKIELANKFGLPYRSSGHQISGLLIRNHTVKECVW